MVDIVAPNVLSFLRGDANEGNDDEDNDDNDDDEDDEDDEDNEDDEDDEDDANGMVAQPDSSRYQFSDGHSLAEEEEAYRRELSRPPLFTLSRCE